jgi:hypothetical protein
MSKQLSGDEHMGKFVYCAQHMAPHSTGWCTVSVEQKVSLTATDLDTAQIECRAKNLPLHADLTKATKT